MNGSTDSKELLMILPVAREIPSLDVRKAFLNC